MYTFVICVHAGTYTIFANRLPTISVSLPGEGFVLFFRQAGGHVFGQAVEQF
jgi:hypothetical protein